MSSIVTAVVVMAAAAVYTGYESYESNVNQKKAQQEMLDKMNQPLPTTDPNAALEDAQKAADQRRMTILASGGQTDITAGTGGLSTTGSGTPKAKTLLGS